jgi:hypothetical protein
MIFKHGSVVSVQIKDYTEARAYGNAPQDELRVEGRGLHGSLSCVIKKVEKVTDDQARDDCPQEILDRVIHGGHTLFSH